MTGKQRWCVVAASVLSCSVLALSTIGQAEPASSATKPAVAATTSPTTRPFAFIDLKHVHNVHRVTDKVISGSQPDGPEGLAELAALGVKTIISVDGITPDAETAKKLGMRYVHLSHGYDGVPVTRAREIAKAINELPGPIYIHCHHGKHRSAAAVAAACIINGSLQPEQADDVLNTFGTGLNYKGLWKSARDARRLDDVTLAAVPLVYEEKAKIGDMAAAMVKVDDHLDHLKQIQKAGWAPPSDHPDLDPPHEALQLEEHLVETGRADYAKGEPAEFHTLLKANVEDVRRLKALLSVKPVDKKAADAALKATNTSCLSCHKVYRDQ